MTTAHQPAPSLDILLPTRDRPTRLAVTLGSLAAQETPQGASAIRLCLLDNGATSAFVDIDVARQLDVLEARGFETYYLRRPRLSGVYAVRRCLYESGRGEVTCFVDDDVVLPPGALTGLWSGVVEHGFALAAGLVVDVDGLHGAEIGFGYQVRETLVELAEQVERDDLAAVGDTWMEMVSPFGTNLMFRRSMFEEAGGWACFEPFFASQPASWGEDVGLCVALKSVGEAFVDVSRVVLHLSPHRRSFVGWETPEELQVLLADRFGADHPSALPSPSRRPGGGRAVASLLRAMAAGTSRR